MSQYKVLLIGSGLMTPPLVEYLVSFQDTHVTIASNIEKDAKIIAERFAPYCSSLYLDIFNQNQLEELVGQH